MKTKLQPPQDGGGSIVATYLRENRDSDTLSVGFLAYLCNLEMVARVSPGIVASIVSELESQRSSVKLIASENYSSLSVQCAMGNLLTDKYAEGVAGARYYAGCENIDAIEAYAVRRACELFGADHAYVQPHSGADANLVAFLAILNCRVRDVAMKELGVKSITALLSNDLPPSTWAEIRHRLGNQRLLGMSLKSGGHLTHGYRMNVSSLMFDAHSYDVDETTHLIDYDALQRQAEKIRPLILLAGYSAYSRGIDFARMRQIADKVGAVLMVDMAHFAGLVAGGVFSGKFSPFPHAHVVTSTTHKTLRGPRGGIVLCQAEFKDAVDKGCPSILGGPLAHVMAAKAACFDEALKPEFKQYAHRIVENSKRLAEALKGLGFTIITGGTENHIVLVNVSAAPFSLTGVQGDAVLRECGITCNKNTIPFDPKSAIITSGLRLGTAAVTTLGMGPEQMDEIASIIHLVLSNTRPATVRDKQGAEKLSDREYTIDPAIREEALGRSKRLLDAFPLYEEIDLSLLKSAFPR
jgi:glycine hydroxymethyltransferase